MLSGIFVLFFISSFCFFGAVQSAHSLLSLSIDSFSEAVGDGGGGVLVRLPEPLW